MIFSQRLENLTREVRSNARLRYCIWILLAILVGYGLVYAREQQDRFIAVHGEKRATLARLQALSSERAWLERVESNRSRAVQLETLLLSANSTGLARAKVQNWINTQTHRSGMDPAKIQVDTARSIDKSTDIWQIAVEIEGLFSTDACLDFLAAVEKDRAFVIEAFKLIRGRQTRCSITLKCYVKAGAS